MGLRLGDIAPNFKAQTTIGEIDFHQYTEGKWTVLFSHPDDYTPVCTTELGAAAGLSEEFEQRGVTLLGLSANSVDSHAGWIKDIDEVSGQTLKFPIIGDEDRSIAKTYDMLDHQDKSNVDKKGLPFTIRTVFVIDPKHTIRLTLAYPASTGRNFAEILRVIDSLQLGDKYKITTPADWKKGDRVIIHPSVQGDKVKELFGDDVDVVKPYLRFTSDPSSK